MMPGSMSPLLVPMTSPSRGVSPMEVSTLFPFCMAVMEAPLPRCAITAFRFSGFFCISLAVCWVTYSCEVPWNPYRLIACFVYSSLGIA